MDRHQTVFGTLALLAPALAAAGCADTIGAPSCGAADVDGLRVAASDPLGGTPYTLGYPPHAVDGCRVAYVAEPAAGEATGPLLLRDLATGEEAVIAPASEAPRRPSLAGDVLAWEADEGGVAVVRVHTGGVTLTLEGPYHHAGEPRAAEDGVVITAFLSEDPLGDSDIYVASPGRSAAEPFFVGPGQQRFADISSSHVAFTDFSEDPDGRFDEDAADVADVVVVSRDTMSRVVRARPGKQAFPLLGADGKVAHLDWGLDHPEPKLSAYDLVIGGVAGAGDDDTLVAEVRTLMPYVRPAARGRHLHWVSWPESGEPSLWTQLADLSSPAERVSGVEGPALLGPAASSHFTLAIVMSGGTATLRAAAY